MPQLSWKTYGCLILLAGWTGGLLLTPGFAQDQPDRASAQTASRFSPGVSKARPAAIANGASLVPSLVAPGSAAVLFGDHLSTDTAAASSALLPLSLANTSVLVNGKAAPLWYVSPEQINFQIPRDAGVGLVSIEVRSGGVTSASVSLSVQRSAPGIFLYGNGRAVAQNATNGYRLNDQNHPAAAGSYVTLYLTGQGEVDNSVPDGVPTPASPLSRSTLPHSATIGGRDAPIQFLGLAPGQVGLLQANVQVPDLRPGDYLVVVKIADSVSNAGLITVAGHGNDNDPAITSLTPGSATAGGPTFQLTVSGANFGHTSSIQWTTGSGTQALPTFYVSDTKLTAMVSASLIASPGYALVAVHTRHGTSNVIQFTINQSAPLTPTISSLVPSTATAGESGLTLTVKGSHFVVGSAVTWTAGGTPTKLATTFVSPSQLTASVPAGLVAAAGTASITVTNPDGSASPAVSFIVAAAPSLACPAANSGEVGVAFNSPAMTVTGGVAPFTFAVVGALPAGLTLNASTGAISGTPSATGSFAIKVTDANGVSAVVNCPFTIVAGPSVSCPTSNSGEVGAPFNSPATTVTGGVAPFTFTVAGTLPAGLTLNASTGAISGTPTAPGSFGVKVTDANGVVATGSNCPFTIIAGPSITCPPANSGEVGAAFSSPAITVTGGIAPYTFAVVGTLPAGLTLNAASGAISGTPTAAGSFGVKVTDARGASAATNCPFTVIAGPSVACPIANSGEVGVAFNSPAMTVTGGTAPYTFTVVGTLPSGLTLNVSTGAISGTPTAPGSFGLNVTDAKGVSAGSNCPFTIVAAPTVNCPTANTGEVGAPFNRPAMTVTGGVAPYTFTVVGTLPAGLTLNAATGAISGTPAAHGTFGIKVTDANGVVATGSNCPFTIVAAPSVACPSANTGEVGVPFNSPAMTVSFGTPPYTFTVTGVLPAGLTLNATTGAITGTPTASGSFGVKVTDARGVAAGSNCSFTIVPAGTIYAPFFGMDVSGAVYTGANPWPTVKFGSMRLWDTVTKWADINTAKGVFNFSTLDERLSKLIAENLSDVILTLGMTPAWISSNATNSSCAFVQQNGPGLCAPPRDLNADGTGTDQAWKDYITALANHLNGRIKHFELWNEPTESIFWTGTVAQLARMAKDAGPILKAVDPQAQLSTASPAPSPNWTDQSWMTQFLAAAGVSAVDLIAFHGNAAGFPPEKIVSLVTSLKTALASSGASSLPLWNTEASWGDNTDLPDLDLQAAYLARFYLLQAGLGVDRLFWYRWDSAARGTLWDATTGVHKAGIAYQQMYNWLVGAYVPGQCALSGTVWTCTVTRPNGYRAQAVWDASQTCSNGSCTTSSYTPTSTYVRYRKLDGSAVTISSGSMVQIGAKPILLENQ
jgi:uncharacterized protein (TIGR03437 family)